MVRVRAGLEERVEEKEEMNNKKSNRSRELKKN